MFRTPSTARRYVTGPRRTRGVNRGVDVAHCSAASLTGSLHQLTATRRTDGSLIGHGVRDGQAMIAALRQRLTETASARASRRRGDPVA